MQKEVETKEEDLLKAIASSQTISWDGAIFTLKMNAIDFAPSKICNLAESHGLKVIGLFVNELEGNKIAVNIKLNSLEIVPFANSLIHNNFSIEYCNVEYKNYDEIRDNYKTLMDYLDL